jgi:DNA-binding CsgD family transcriptional regulator
MNEVERVSQLIDRLYDAALDPAQWSKVIEKTSKSRDDRAGKRASVDALQAIIHYREPPGMPQRDIDVLVSHLRRALSIGEMITLHKVQAAILAETLDGFAAGMFLVDRQARIVHANASGKAMLDKGDVVQERTGRLTAGERRTDEILLQAIATAAAGATPRTTIPLCREEAEYWDAHVLSLTSSGRRHIAGLCCAAVAAVFVRRAALNSCPLGTISDLYGLTPAELRVLVAIVEVGGVREVAQALGVSETTVKSHLQRVYEKTGSRRQADVVKLVASHMNPTA